MLHKEGFAFAGVEFLHRNQARRWNSILPAPCRILSDFVSAAKPGNVSRHGEDFWRRRRQFPILTFRSPFGVNGVMVMKITSSTSRISMNGVTLMSD